MKRKKISLVFLILGTFFIFVNKIYGFNTETYKGEIERDINVDNRHSEIIQEAKIAEQSLGKSAIDMHGNRVRIEEYIFTPQPNQLKTLVLNTRAERFDYGYKLFTFNTAVPEDSSIRRELTWDGRSKYGQYVTELETYFSNTVDYYKEIQKGGHPSSEYILFNYYIRTINGIPKLEGTRNSDSWDDITWTYHAGEPVKYVGRSEDELYMVLGVNPNESSRWIMLIKYGNGTFEKWETANISKEGKILVFGEMLYTDLIENNAKWFKETIITATEFNGRSIDIVTSPYFPCYGGPYFDETTW